MKNFSRPVEMNLSMQSNFPRPLAVPRRKDRTLETVLNKDGMAVSVTIEVTETPDEAALARVETELAAFNDADVGPSEKATLAIIVRDENGAVLAGISGYTAWGWLYIQKLWVDDSLRGQGMAGRMLAAAEEEAERRGCHSALIDTFNPSAEKAYTRQGYVEFGRLENFPIGRSRIFLQKRLRSSHTKI